jgi:hypothetical protein
VHTRLIQDHKSVSVDKILERVNDHHVVIHFGHRFPNPLADRDFVHRYMFKKVTDDEFLLVVRPCEHNDAPAQPDVVRAQIFRAFRVTKISEGVAQVTCTTQTDLAGSIPQYVNDAITTPTAAGAPLSALRTTVQVKKTAQLDAAGQDARALGQLLVHDMEPVRTKKKLLESQLHVFLFRTTVLRELCDARPWFEALLHQVLLNEAQIKIKGVSGVEGFTQEDGRATGAKLALLLIKKPPLTAVDVVSPARERRARAGEAAKNV